jgi:hypothetical protein
MLRRFVAAAVVLLLGVGALIAADAMMTKGKIKKVDTPEKGPTVITVTTDDKDQDFRVGKMAKVVDATADPKDPKEAKVSDLKEGQGVTVTWEEVEKDGKKRKRVSEVKITSKPKPTDKDKDK